MVGRTKGVSKTQISQSSKPPIRVNLSTRNPSIHVVQSQDGFVVTMRCYGATWTLRTVQPSSFWMINAEGWVTRLPLKTFRTSRRMQHPSDSVEIAVREAKYQIFRLRYQKTSPSFHEQHLRQFPVTQCLETPNDRNPTRLPVPSGFSISDRIPPFDI